MILQTCKALTKGCATRLTVASDLLAKDKERKAVLDYVFAKVAEEVAKQQAIQQAQEDAMRPLEQQRELLEAKLKGNEKEVRLRQQAENIARDIVDVWMLLLSCRFCNATKH